MEKLLRRSSDRKHTAEVILNTCVSVSLWSRLAVPRQWKQLFTSIKKCLEGTFFTFVLFLVFVLWLQFSVWLHVCQCVCLLIQTNWDKDSLQLIRSLGGVCVSDYASSHTHVLLKTGATHTHTHTHTHIRTHTQAALHLRLLQTYDFTCAL